jgi:hypothetical protein
VSVVERVSDESRSNFRDYARTQVAALQAVVRTVAVAVAKKIKSKHIKSKFRNRKHMLCYFDKNSYLGLKSFLSNWIFLFLQVIDQKKIIQFDHFLSAKTASYK